MIAFIIYLTFELGRALIEHKTQSKQLKQETIKT